MSLYKGNSNIGTIYVGNKQVQSIYRGNSLVYSAKPTTALKTGTSNQYLLGTRKFGSNNAVFTIEVCWKIVDMNTSTDTYNCGILRDGGTGNSGFSFMFGKTTGSTQYLQMYCPGGTTGNLTNAILTKNVWEYWRFKFNGSTIYAYKNNVLQDSAGASYQSINGGGANVYWILGQGSYGNTDMVFQYVRVWNILSDDTLYTNTYQSYLTGTYSGLIGNYYFNEGTPNANNTSITNVIDYSNTQNLTLNGFTLTGTVSNYVNGNGIV